MIFFRKNDGGQVVQAEYLNELTPEHDVLCRALSYVCVSEIVDRVHIVDGLERGRINDDGRRSQQVE